MMPNPNNRWPIEIFLAEALGMTDRNRLINTLTKRLAPANATKARRRLRDLFETGCCPPELAERLAPLFPSLKPWFWKAVEETRYLRGEFDAEQARQAREREIASFEPHLFKRTERSVPSPIFVVALTGIPYWLHIPLPKSIANFGWNEQCALVARAAREGSTAAGRRASEMIFGATVGYYYRPTWDACYAVSLSGTVSSQDLGAVQEPRVTYSVGHKLLSMEDRGL